MAALNSPKVLWFGMALVIAACSALVGLNVYQAVGVIPALEQNRELVVHTFQVITTAQSLDQAMQDAERGQRGFLITGDTSYLDLYRAGAETTPVELSKLRQLTSDNPEQQRRMPILEDQINVRLAQMSRTIDVRQREGFDAARQMMQTDVGADSMRTANALINAAIATENGLLTQRLANVARDERDTRDVAQTGGALTLLIMGLGVALILIALSNMRRSEQKRLESEERFDLVVQGLSDHAIFMLDPAGKVLSWNTAAARMEGYTAEEIIGQHFMRFLTDEDRDSGAWGQTLETAAREGKYEAETWRVRKDGSRFVANVVINPLHDPAGHLIGFAKITRDLTERIRQREALEQTRAALAQSQKMETLGQLSGGIAHDFNNMLAVIKSGIALLRRRLQTSDPDIKRFIDGIERGADRAASLTQRLLAFSRRQPLAPKPFDPNKLIAGMADLLCRALGESVEMETVLAAGSWWVSVDPNQLENAILNLAVNARDAMPDGGKLTIETGNVFLDDAYAAAHDQVTAGQYAMIAVSDTGTGMMADIVAKAFEPFFTTKETGQGTGLGLSQVYGFIKQSAGHIKIYSEPGQGTTVKLYLPRLTAGEAADTPTQPRLVAAVQGGMSKQTILLVEDDEDVRTFTAEMIAQLGYRVLIAGDARSALALLESEPGVDLLFTDVGLPNGVNGRQLADEACRRWPALRVLFTTGYARNAIVHHGRLDPGVELILKPFTQGDVAQKLRRVLNGPEEPAN